MVSSVLCPPSGNSRRSASGSSSSMATSSESKMGSDTTYFSAAHAPRSIKRQRSEQNGKSASVAESVVFLQMGQWCFMVKKMFYHLGRIGTRAERTGGRWWLKISKGGRPIELLRTGKRRPPRKAAATTARGRGEPLPYKVAWG